MRRARFVVVGCPRGRRVALFQEALRRMGIGPAHVVSYLDLLAGSVEPGRALAGDCVVRIESPGIDFEVERELILLGARRSGEGVDPSALTFDRGRVLYPRLWYSGYRSVLRALGRGLRSAPPLALMSDPAEIEVMFDKRRCHELLDRGGVPVARALGEAGGYAELRGRMADARCPRVFVKLACGSSASGVVAYETSGAREQAWTTVEIARDGGEVRLYNSRRIRRYRDRGDIAAIVDAVCREGAHVEAWVPKASLNGRAFDLRVLTIGGRAAHCVPRLGDAPMTNLHLGSARGDLRELVDRIGAGAWAAVRDTCERAAALFPRSLHVGVDVGLTPGFRGNVVFEVNAFGDLLPGILHEGRDTYEAEVLAVLGRAAAPAASACTT